jgi:hypothetical protein
MPKRFRVATEGATTDGRTISRTWIEQMAANYDPARYGARIWLEHMRGLFPDGPMPALGDVVALSAMEEDGKLALYAELDPTDRLKEINDSRQKVYTSIEVDPDFAGSGEAYLIGLGVTDSPASLGTEMLKFSSQQGEDSPLAARKQSPRNVFSAAVETELDFSETDPAPAAPDDKPSLFDAVKALFTKYRKAGQADLGAFRADLEHTLELFVKENSELRSQLEQRAAADDFAKLQEQHQALSREFSALREKLDATPDSPNRSSATGTDGGIETDC